MEPATIRSRASQRLQKDFRDPKGNTALMLAVKNANFKTVKALIKDGVNVNDTNASGKTALFHTRNKKMWRILINAGADVNVQDNQGWTVLMTILQQIQNDDDLDHFSDHIRLLFDAGADVHGLRNNTGDTAIDLCETENCKALLIKLAPLPADIKRMIASGLNYRDIQSLCLVNKEWNEKVCNNDAFYKALLDRGDAFQDKRFDKDFIDENAERVDYARSQIKVLTVPTPPLIEFLDGEYRENTDTIRPYDFAPHQPEPDYVRKNILAFARLPGSDNTVTYEGEEYIWYYFFWAPRNNKYTNYSKKYSDDEIMDDLRDDEVFRSRFCGRTHGGTDWNEPKHGCTPFGLSIKRLQILLFNKGIACVRLAQFGVNNWYLARGATQVENADRILDLIENQNLNVPDGFVSLHNVFDIDHPSYRRFFGGTIARLMLNVLRPATFEDLALEYYVGPSFALTVQMQSLSTIADKRAAYKELLDKYNVVHNLKKLTERLRGEFNRKRTFLLIASGGILRKMIGFHINRLVGDDIVWFSPNSPFPYTDTLWPEELHDVLRHLLTTAEQEREERSED